MSFNQEFYSRFLHNSNCKMNLEDIVPVNIRERQGFSSTGSQLHGTPSYEFINYLTNAFYDPNAFDLGQSPIYVPNRFHNPSYEFDMWWSIGNAAYNNMTSNHAFDTGICAMTIYDAFCHNYIYWTAKTGEQPTSNAFPMPYLQDFWSLPSHIAIRFFFLADLGKLLYASILSSITKDQLRIYADACMAMAINSLPVYGFSTYDL